MPNITRFQLARFNGRYYVADTKLNRFVDGPFVYAETASKHLRRFIRRYESKIGRIRKSKSLLAPRSKNRVSMTKPKSNPSTRTSDIDPRREQYTKGDTNKYWYDKGWRDQTNGYRMRSRKKHYVIGYKHAQEYELTRMYHAGKLSNPRNVLIYGRVLRVEAEKTQPHVCDAECKAAGHRYFHDFKKGSDVHIYGMPDKSLRMVSKKGR